MSKGHHRNWMVRLIRWYQKHISAHTAPRCRYYPSCSNYAIQAIERFGCLKGGLLALLRLLRCNQWNRGGIDDVPQLYSLFYRCSWSKAHEEPRLTPLDVDEPIGDKENALNTSSDLNNVFIAGISSSPTLDYQFLDEYLDSVLLLEDREEMITFTEKIYTKIDSLPGVKKELLKGMVSIALCSINLWVPV